jgi:hypothetical protein
MTCTEARRHWMLYLESEGDAALHLRVREHLADCPACADWFAGQERLEHNIRERLTAGAETPELWQRVLTRTGVRSPVRRRHRLFIVGAALAAGAVLLAVFFGWPGGNSAPADELARRAADLHERWVRGDVRPEFVSDSDLEVDRYLKATAPFPVHCPPRSDVNFAVRGAGVCSLPEQQQAAYIVGRVDRADVSILVLDRASLGAFPRDREHLRDGRPHHRREGDYQTVAGVVAENVVVVTGRAPAEALEKLLIAYGTYPD